MDAPTPAGRSGMFRHGVHRARARRTDGASMTLSRIERISAYLLFAVVALAPLPMGANRPWAWIPLATLCVAIFAIQASADLRRPGPAAQDLKRARLPIIGFSLVLVWVSLQATSWTASSWDHPAYAALNASGAISVHPERTAQFGLRLLGYGAAFWVAVRLGRDPRCARLGMTVIACSAAALVIFSVGRIIWLDAFGERITGSFVNQNSFATFAGFGALISAAYLAQALRPGGSVPTAKEREALRALALNFSARAALPLAGFLICATGVLMTGSRGGMAATLAGLLIMSGQYAFVHHARKTPPLSALMATLAMPGIWIAGDSALETWLATDWRSEIRPKLYDSIITGIGEHGAFGVGLGGFWEGFRPYKDALLGRSTWDLGHNSYLENIFELGWIAATLLYSALALIVLRCMRGVTRRQKDQIYPTIGVSASVLAGLHAAVDFSLQMPAIATAYAIILGLSFAQSWPTRLARYERQIDAV